MKEKENLQMSVYNNINKFCYFNERKIKIKK